MLLVSNTCFVFRYCKVCMGVIRRCVDLSGLGLMISGKKAIIYVCLLNQLETLRRIC